MGIVAFSPNVFNVVVCGAPFQRICMVPLRFEPATTRLKGEEPAVADDGVSVVITGSGRIVKVVPALETPSAVFTVMVAVVPVDGVSWAVGMTAVSVVAFTKVVASAVVPFHITVSAIPVVFVKLAPVMVTVIGCAPAVPEVGLMLVIVGAATTGKRKAGVVNPPGSCTVTDSFPGVVRKLALTGIES